MPSLATDALVLRTFPLGETSRVVVFLTRERGKLRAVAKGARGPRSRYRSTLESFSEVHVELYGRQGAELYRIGGCELLRSAFGAGSRGLEAALSLSYFAELLDAFSQEGEAEDDVYRLALAVLAATREDKSVMVLGRYLEAWLMKLHGIYPPGDRCSSCGGPLPPGGLGFHAPARGFVCRRCGPASGPLLSPASRDFLLEVWSRPPAALGEVAAEVVVALEAFHQDLISHHLERGLRSHRVLKDVAREMRG
jgi:DNA repair protein RecO (recombination protein O)